MFGIFNSSNRNAVSASQVADSTNCEQVMQRVIHIKDPGCLCGSLTFGLLYRFGKMRVEYPHHAQSVLETCISRVLSLHDQAIAREDQIGAFMRQNQNRIDIYKNAITTHLQPQLSNAQNDVDAHQRWINERSNSEEALIGVQFYSALSFLMDRGQGKLDEIMNYVRDNFVEIAGKFLDGQMRLENTLGRHQQSYITHGFRDLFQCSILEFELTQGQIKCASVKPKESSTLNPICILWSGEKHEAVVNFDGKESIVQLTKY